MARRSPPALRCIHAKTLRSGGQLSVSVGRARSVGAKNAPQLISDGDGKHPTPKQLDARPLRVVGRDACAPSRRSLAKRRRRSPAPADVISGGVSSAFRAPLPAEGVDRPCGLIRGAQTAERLSKAKKKTKKFL